MKRELFDLLVRKVREHRMTLLLITHDIAAAVHIADAVIALDGGRMLQDEQQRAYIEKSRRVYNEIAIEGVRPGVNE